MNPGRLTYFLYLSCLMAIVGGCAPARVAPGPPVSRAQYRAASADARSAYADHTVVRVNLHRVLSEDLPLAQRQASLELLGELAARDPLVHKALSMLLDRPSSPEPLRVAVLELLLEADYPGIARYVVQALPSMESEDLRARALDWLGRHSGPSVLGEIVNLWAEDPGRQEEQEDQYRWIVSRLGGRQWDDALLYAVNTPSFNAAGAAMEVLSERHEPSSLRRKLTSLSARTEAVLALQAFLAQFDYLPTTREQYRSTIATFKSYPQLLSDASGLYRQWQQQAGYRFQIHDLHLLARLARDPLRPKLTRDRLLEQLSKRFRGREHVRGMAPQRGRTYGGGVWLVVERLDMADLWRLLLVDEMLSRPRVQKAISILARRDRADRAHAWGGLVFYQTGQAEALVYPAASDELASDLEYRPSQRALKDGRFSLLRFHGHFERVTNAQRAGPTDEDLARAADDEANGLVLTSLSETAFAAHYYTHEGVVVSVGVFPFNP